MYLRICAQSNEAAQANAAAPWRGVDNRPRERRSLRKLPVASWLCPRWRCLRRDRGDLLVRLHRGRPADEGDAPAAQRLADSPATSRLGQRFRSRPLAALAAVRAGRASDPPARPAGAATLHDLLTPSAQDVVKQRYVDRAELFDYCCRSRQPGGPAVAALTAWATSARCGVRCHLHGAAAHQLLAGPERRRSARPAFTSSSPTQQRFGPTRAELGAAPTRPRSRAARARGECDWARALMPEGRTCAGAPVPGRAGLGAAARRARRPRILDRKSRRWTSRRSSPGPAARPDAPVMLWRALRMRTPDGAAGSAA